MSKKTIERKRLNILAPVDLIEKIEQIEDFKYKTMTALVIQLFEEYVKTHSKVEP